METKFCYRCRTIKYKKEFGKDKSRKDGLANTCKPCLKIYMKQYYETNKEILLEKQRAYSTQYYEDNKENITIYKRKYDQDNKVMVSAKSKIYKEKHRERDVIRNKKYYETNKETLAINHKPYLLKNKLKILTYQKEYREANKKIIAIKKSKYCKEHLEEYRINGERRRTLKKSLPSTLTVQQWENIKLHFNNKCAYCNKKLPLAQEHFIALSKGGEYTVNNIIPSCQSCNSSKGTKKFLDWYLKYKYYSKTRERAILKFLNYENGF